jgi:predicted RecA/RadA family phage recombinase
MQNYIQNGHIVRVTAPAGGIASGDPLIVGSIFGVAAYSSAEGDPVELSTTGVFQLPKASTAVLTVGASVAWDSTAGEVTTPAAGRFPIGVAVEAAGNGVTSVAVRLDGVATAAA